MSRTRQTRRSGLRPDRRDQKPLATLLLGVAVLLLGAAPASAASRPLKSSSVLRHRTANASHKYSVVLINNFIGNTWRPQMERDAELIASRSPFNKEVSSLKVVLSQNNPASESSAINTEALSRPNLLLIDSASASAENQSVEAACRAGITVVSFDVLVTAPCAWKIAVNFGAEGYSEASWMAKTIGGHGTVFMDLGTAGATSSAAWVAGARRGLSKYPGIRIYTWYADFSPGGEESGVASLVTADPDVAGILTQDYGAYSLDALAKAGHQPVPVTGYAYNISLETCAKYKAPCLLHSVPPWVSGQALQLGLKVLDHQKSGKPSTQWVPTTWFESNHVSFPAQTPLLGPVEPLLKGIQRSLPAGVMLPISPPWIRPALTASEVTSRP